MQTFTLVLLSALDRESLDTQGRGPQHSARQIDSHATTHGVPQLLHQKGVTALIYVIAQWFLKQ